MTVYESLVVMISFASLIVSVLVLAFTFSKKK